MLFFFHLWRQHVLSENHCSAIAVWEINKCTCAYTELITCTHNISCYVHTCKHAHTLTHWQYTCIQTHALRISTITKQHALTTTKQHALTIHMHTNKMHWQQLNNMNWLQLNNMHWQQLNSMHWQQPNNMHSSRNSPFVSLKTLDAERFVLEDLGCRKLCLWRAEVQIRPWRLQCNNHYKNQNRHNTQC